MSIEIKAMVPEHATHVQKLARKAFKGTESLFVTKPKKCLVAYENREVIGGLMYKYETYKGQKVGYVDFIFVHPDHAGKGIGNMLLKEAVDLMWSEDCDYLSAIIKDDNVGSWKLFLKYGFRRMTYPGLIKNYGVLGLLKLITTTPFGVGVGMEYYLVKKEGTCQSDKNPTKQLFSYLALNLILFMLFFIGRSTKLFTAFIAGIIVYSGLILSGYIGTLFSKNRFKFRMNEGGLLMSTIIHTFFGMIPMIGNWYPEDYEKGIIGKRKLGIVGLCKWLFVLVMAFLPVVFHQLPVLILYVSNVAYYLLIMFAIPLYPFESLAGGRVFKWHKLFYIVMLILSFTTVVLV